MKLIAVLITGVKRKETVMRFVSVLIVMAATFSASNAFSATKYSAEYSACTSKASDTTSMRDCNGEELVRQNARLNEAYKWAMGALSEEKQKTLKATQALWAKLRDGDCSMYYSLTGGTMDVLNGSSCELSMTSDRADTLEFFADNGGEVGGE